MASLLDEVVDAHGGLDRWNQLEHVHAHLIQGGVLWALKGHSGQLADVFVTANLHQQWVSHEPFLSPILRSIYTPDQVIIEEKDGPPDESLESPRESFAGHTLETHWSNLQLVYFVGTSMWTYLTQPFTYALPGFDTEEIDPWDEKGERWRRLRVTWPERPVGHSRVQTLYISDDGLIRRFDYEIDIAGGAAGTHLLEGYSNIAGIMVPASHRIFARDDHGTVIPDPLMVSIDVDQVVFGER
jgi:hypothetical protein